MPAANHKEIRFEILKEAFSEIAVNFDLEIEDLEAKQLDGLSLYPALNILAYKSIAAFKKRFLEKFWQDYLPLLTERGFEFNLKFEEDRINSAIRNAFFIFMGLSCVIPKIYFHNYGKHISETEYRKAFQNMLNLVRHLSMMHFDDFRAFIYATTKIEIGVGTKLHVFHRENFDLDDELNLFINAEGQRRTEKEKQKLIKTQRAHFEEATLGCPAGFVANSEGEDLIAILHAWVYKLLDKFYFPNIDYATPGPSLKCHLLVN